MEPYKSILEVQHQREQEQGNAVRHTSPCTIPHFITIPMPILGTMSSNWSATNRQTDSTTTPRESLLQVK
ncbi:hypothetical protein ACLKA6_019899 [Drosophila palustris]